MASPVMDSVALITFDTPDGRIELISSRMSEGQGFSFKVTSSGRIYRIDSAREPHSPRFWCFRIVRCSTAGVVDITERPWYGGDRTTRDDLSAAVTAIRSAPDQWLALPQHADLRTWIFQPLHSATEAPREAPPRHVKAR